MSKVQGFGGIDYPDFGGIVLPHENPVTISLDELAVRLGSGVDYERTGNVLFMDGFQNGIARWYVNGYPSGCTPTVGGVSLSSKPYSLRLYTDGTANAYSLGELRLPYLYLASFGIELTFLTRSEFDRFYFQMLLYNGAYRYLMQMRLDNVAKELEIYRHPGTWQIIDTYSYVFASTSGSHRIKLVADMASMYYKRLLFDYNDYNLASYQVRQTASTEEPKIVLGVVLYGNTGTSCEFFIDNVIITYNEP